MADGRFLATLKGEGEGEIMRYDLGLHWTRELERKLRLFAASGRIVRHNDELFTEVGWLQVMLGQGAYPASHHPLADQLTSSQLAEFMNMIRSVIDHETAAMPSHADFVAGNCRAEK